jgi:hypothetical protein
MQDQRFTKSAKTISPKLARLKSASISELKQQWRTLYGSEPPHRISRELLTCRSVSSTGASLRRAKAFNQETTPSSRRRSSIRTPA